jgi:hypothetical protein
MKRDLSASVPPKSLQGEKFIIGLMGLGLVVLLYLLYPLSLTLEIRIRSPTSKPDCHPSNRAPRQIILLARSSSDETQARQHQKVKDITISSNR